MKCKRVVGCLLLLMIGCCPMESQSKKPLDLREIDSLQSVKERPDRGIPYSTIGEFRLASRKDTYTVGEMIGLDLAMLNRGTNNVFFSPLRMAEFYAQGPADVPSKIRPYVVLARSFGAESFARTAPNNVVVEHVDVLAGCDTRAFAQVNSSANGLDDRAIFERNLFLDWGKFCLQLTEPGTYVFTAEIKNDTVVMLPTERRTKTAVGKIRSNPLTITIIK